jgi:methionyl aminopeptidase
MIRRSDEPQGVTEAEARLAHAAAQCVVETHRRLAAWLRAGQTVAEIDRFVASTLADLKCKSCFLGYRVPKSPPFPSHACLSVNECVVHGTAASHRGPLKHGDLLKIDIGVLHQGWIGDAAWTYSFGEPTEEVARLMDCGKRSILLGIETLQPSALLIDWAAAVQRFVERDCGFHLIRGLGGHGYGRKLHAPPFVSNTVPTMPGEWPDATLRLRPGTLIAVEPMIAVGTGRVLQDGHDWPLCTADGSQSVHYEHNVLITESGPRILTEGLDDLPDIITR